MYFINIIKYQNYESKKKIGSIYGRPIIVGDINTKTENEVTENQIKSSLLNDPILKKVYETKQCPLEDFDYLYNKAVIDQHGAYQSYLDNQRFADILLASSTDEGNVFSYVFILYSSSTTLRRIGIRRYNRDNTIVVWDGAINVF